jgi:hypothetical protein
VPNESKSFEDIADDVLDNEASRVWALLQVTNALPGCLPPGGRKDGRRRTGHMSLLHRAAATRKAELE